MIPENKIAGSLIIGYDIDHSTDNTVLIVGKREPNQSVKVINAFEGEEAYELYKKLITKKESE
jgi:hypothetical protein